MVARAVADPNETEGLEPAKPGLPAYLADEHLGLPPSGANWITVVPEPNVAIHASTDHVRIRPGHDVTLNLSIERRNGFAGRVPIDVRNLPYGVAVQNIGLNGVLVTEQASDRTITLHAEPWVNPQTGSFFAVARCEPAGTEAASSPIVLEVEPLSEAPPTTP